MDAGAGKACVSAADVVLSGGECCPRVEGAEAESLLGRRGAFREAGGNGKCQQCRLGPESVKTLAFTGIELELLKFGA